MGQHSALPPKTLVFVTDQFRCERLICTGRGLADYSSSELEVVSIQPEGCARYPQAIEHLFEISRQNHCQMSVLYAEDVLAAMTDYIKQNHTVNVVTGAPGDENSLLYQVFKRFPQIPFFTVAPDGEISTVTKFKPA